MPRDGVPEAEANKIVARVGRVVVVRRQAERWETVVGYLKLSPRRASAFWRRVTLHMISFPLAQLFFHRLFTNICPVQPRHRAWAMIYGVGSRPQSCLVNSEFLTWL